MQQRFSASFILLGIHGVKARLQRIQSNREMQLLKTNGAKAVKAKVHMCTYAHHDMVYLNVCQCFCHLCQQTTDIVIDHLPLKESNMLWKVALCLEDIWQLMNLFLQKKSLLSCILVSEKLKFCTLVGIILFLLKIPEVVFFEKCLPYAVTFCKLIVHNH